MSNTTIHYRKRKNTTLFKKLDEINIVQCQNYIPIYNLFFSLNDTNYNSINLNHKWFLESLKNPKEDINNKHEYLGILQNTTTEKSVTKKIFIKMAPLLDPFKYFLGKYNNCNNNLFNLPSINNNIDIHPKILGYNNLSYVDGLFVFLTDKLLHDHSFIHGLEFYGSFLAIKNNFKINVMDDLEHLIKSDFFNKNVNTLFTIDDYSHLIDTNTAKLKPIQIMDTKKSSISISCIDDTIFENIFEPNSTPYDNVETNMVTDTDTDRNNHITLDEMKNMQLELLDITNSNVFTIDPVSEQDLHSDSESDCSSRTSHTNDTDTEVEVEVDAPDADADSDTNRNAINDSSNNSNSSVHNSESDEICSNASSSFTDETDTDYDETLFATIHKFPVQIISMENCENTLDSLIVNEELKEEEYLSAFMQIIMILITYQKTFSMTHNDLHTNNVMYISTSKKFLYYSYNNVTYKVPTFGKIYKIIDFGRAIYKFNGKTLCSDSFKSDEDAGGQYNTEPFYNSKKPRLDPNFSFDLCRLACSIFDYIIDDLDDIKDLSKCDPVTKLIVEWCLDDNKNNVLYKSNGDERYPDFKLYKMIARCVHNHTPQAQLSRQEFKQYEVQSKNVPKDTIIMNIDNYPCYCD